MATNTGRLTGSTYDTSTRIRSTRAEDTGRRTSGTGTGKQGELDLCRYLRSAYRHRPSRSPQMSSAISITGKFIRKTVKNLPTGLANII